MADEPSGENNTSGNARTGITQPLRVVRIEKSSEAYPAAWDADAEDGSKLYVHYRYDLLSVKIAEHCDTDGFAAATNGALIFEQILTEDAGMGRLTFGQLVRTTHGVINRPDAESERPKTVSSDNDNISPTKEID